MEFWCWVFRQAGMGFPNLEILGDPGRVHPTSPETRHAFVNIPGIPTLVQLALQKLKSQVLEIRNHHRWSSSGQIPWKKSLLTSIFLGGKWCIRFVELKTSLKMNGWNLNMPTWKRKDHLSEPNLQESGFRIKFQGCTCGSMVFPCTLGLDPSEGRPLWLEDWPHEGSGQLLGFCALNCYDFCLHSQLQRKHRKNPVSLSASSVAMRSSKESPESPKFFHHPTQLQNIRRKSQI